MIANWSGGLCVGQVGLQPRGEGDACHGNGVVEGPEAHVTSDDQSAEVLERPRLFYGHT